MKMQGVRFQALPVLAGAGALVGLLWLSLAGPLPRAYQEARPPIVVFHGYSVLGEVFSQSIFPAFQKQWQVRTGEQLHFIGSFDGLAQVTRELIRGVPAHLALLSAEIGARQLAEAGVIEPESWTRLPHGGVLNQTPFVIAVRPGNPLGIKDFGDLARPGVKVVHPDPSTSGGAYWAIFAEHTAGVRQGGDWQGGFELLRGIWKNVVARAVTAREARTLFESGLGDAVVTSEQDLLWGKARGTLKAEIVYPPRTILSDTTLVILEKNIEPRVRAAIDSFIEFLWSEEAQRLFVESGFRSAREALNATRPEFVRLQGAFRIEDLGGWKAARREILDTVWKRVEKELEE